MVEVRRVDVVHSAVDGVVKQPRRGLLVDLVRRAERGQAHAAEAEGGDVDAGPAERAIPHGSLLIRPSKAVVAGGEPPVARGGRVAMYWSSLQRRAPGRTPPPDEGPRSHVARFGNTTFWQSHRSEVP